MKPMAIQEITIENNLHNPRWTNTEEQPLHQVWELNILNNLLVLERYGSICGWAELKLKKKGNEVYRIVKPWGKEERTEYFFNRQIRSYRGDQFSFIEYLVQMVDKERFPSAEEYFQAGLESNIENIYRQNLQKILE